MDAQLITLEMNTFREILKNEPPAQKALAILEAHDGKLEDAFNELWIEENGPLPSTIEGESVWEIKLKVLRQELCGNEDFRAQVKEYNRYPVNASILTGLIIYLTGVAGTSINPAIATVLVLYILKVGIYSFCDTAKLAKATADETPVDDFASEKQQRLLTRVLYSSWSGPGDSRTFLVAANVGIFTVSHQPPIVPDVFLSLDVQVAEDWWEKQNRSYLLWEFGKVPEVVIEIISDRNEDELGTKLRDYERMRVSYYVVFDPIRQLGESVLQIYQLRGTRYVPMTDAWLESVGLGLTLWQGKFEDKEEVWLRWCDQQGNILLTGSERAEQIETLLEQERRRAEQAEFLLKQERQRADYLADQLRALGHDPDQRLS